ncbi:MFS transporter [Brevibacillus choshinensis]|uniref:MFS transporter n=1 Tax=Brevibacillus choshinensis TaxID=54911 RepID=UPI001EEE54A1|nr:MFS transporter [Brevibacillus choshinensis]
MNQRVLWILSIAQFLSMQVWFNFSAIMPVVQRQWELSSTQSGIIVATFHLGYVLAVIFYSFASDKYNPKYSFAYGSLVAGMSGLLFASVAEGFWSALVLRLLSGIGIAGVYVPGMKIVAQLSPPASRGKAMGVFVGSLVVGSGFSLFVSGMLLNAWGWQGVIVVTSCAAILSCGLILMSRIPEVTLSSTPVTKALLKKIVAKRNLLVNFSYAGHCWELYAMWAWIGPFMVYYFQQKGISDALSWGNLTASIIVMVGGIATYYGGKLSDRWGNVRAIRLFIWLSIACSFSIGWMISFPVWIVGSVALLYGFTIIADSPIYNKSIADMTDPEVLGIALGVQSVLGFSFTIISPAVFGMALDYGHWGGAFTVIAIGTLVTPLCLRALRTAAAPVENNG